MITVQLPWLLWEMVTVVIMTMVVMVDNVVMVKVGWPTAKVVVEMVLVVSGWQRW